jgi:hypothetical protein
MKLCLRDRLAVYVRVFLYVCMDVCIHVYKHACLFPLKYLNGDGVLLAVDSQSTSKSGYRASLWDP